MNLGPPAGTAELPFEYKRKQADFGRPTPIQQGADGRPWITKDKIIKKTWTMFQDRGPGPELVEDMLPQEGVAEENFITRATTTAGVQCSPFTSEGSVSSTPAPAACKTQSLASGGELACLVAWGPSPSANPNFIL